MFRLDRIAWLVVGLASLLVLGCGESQTPPRGAPQDDRTTSKPTTPRPAEPAPTPTAPPSPPSPAAEPDAPSAPVADAGPRDPQAGGVIYAQYCASCHGASGGGDGPISGGLNPKPARHDDGDYMNALTNEHLFKVIKQGGMAVGKSPLMAPWGTTLKDDQIWDVVAFVRGLANPPYTSDAP